MPRHRLHAKQLVHIALLYISGLVHAVTGANVYDGTHLVAGGDTSDALVAGESTGRAQHHVAGPWTRTMSRYEL